MVVLSDQHKGVRDRADDFSASEPAYCAALAHYLEDGFELHVLGDAEELWENPPGPVLADYAHALSLEAEFHAAGRYVRYWGNHDDLWAHPDAVRRHLHPLFPGLRVHEALKLRLTRPGRPDGLLLLLHGHQGSRNADHRAWVSKLFVRHVWRRIQRGSDYLGATPSKDYAMRAKLSREIAGWALAHPSRPIVIAGHTHKPVFWDSFPTRPEPAGDGRPAREYAAAVKRNPRRTYTLETPCYFNSGCCCFGDGDITGLEIAGGEMRLVKWSATRTVLALRPLDEILGSVIHLEPDARTR